VTRAASHNSPHHPCAPNCLPDAAEVPSVAPIAAAIGRRRRKSTYAAPLSVSPPVSYWVPPRCSDRLEADAQRAAREAKVLEAAAFVKEQTVELERLTTSMRQAMDSFERRDRRYSPAVPRPQSIEGGAFDFL
jgi:hypothetical protein